MKTFKPITTLLIMLLTVSPLLVSCQHNAKPGDPISDRPTYAHVQRGEVSGITNFSRAGMMAGFGGTTQPSAMAWLKDDGFGSVINLRLESEEGVDLDASRSAAEAMGLNYIHLPLDTENVDPQIIDDFLAAVGDEINQPVYVHCGSATRAAALWMIKRVTMDDWDIDEAGDEARAIAKKPDAAVAFATQYIASQ